MIIDMERGVDSRAHRSDQPSDRRFGGLLVVLSLATIGGLTLSPDDAVPPAEFVWTPTADPGHLVEDVLNVALFCPLGLALRLLGVSAGATLMISAALSCSVELLQLWVIPGRYSELQDILANTAGAAFGALLARSLRGRLDRRHR